MRNLENLTIHQFRGLRDLTLQSLGQINLLVGVNNSGKTSVLEAISTYCRPLDPLEWLNTAWRREIKFSRKSKLDSLKWLFPQNKGHNSADFYAGETHISGTGEYPLLESQAFYQEFEGVWDSDGDADEIENERDDEFDGEELNPDKIRGGADLGLKITRLQLQHELFNSNTETTSEELNFKIWENERFISRKNRDAIALPVDTVTPFSHRVEQWQSGLLSEARLSGFKADVIQLLKILDDDILDLEILSDRGDRPRLYVDHQKMGLSPLSAFGDGIRRLLFIASSLAKVKDGILLVDEIETAIHTEALADSFSWLSESCKRMNVQLFATTHSLEAVDAMSDATQGDRDLVLYRLERQGDRTHAIRFEHDRLQRLRQDLGQEVRW